MTTLKRVLLFFVVINGALITGFVSYNVGKIDTICIIMHVNQRLLFNGFLCKDSVMFYFPLLFLSSFVVFITL